MKKLLLFSQCLLSLTILAQTTITGSITHTSGVRTYQLYVPAAYSAGTPVPLVLNLHGYGSNDTQQMAYANFKPIADTANFLVLAPQGTNDGSGTAYWNAGFGGSVNDIDFINALLDSISLTYSVDQNRIYSTGMSNGGYMSLTLAGQLDSRIAAVASVTGSMTIIQIPLNTVTRPVPVMQIHGDADPTVPYLGNSTSLSIDSVLKYWVAHNNCDALPVFTALPNINTTDGCTAEKYEYLNGDNGSEVVHYKIIGGAHTWPGAAFNIGVTNQDFNACIEIWKFFSRYEKSTLVNVSQIKSSNNWIKIISENPTDGIVRLQTNSNKQFLYEVYDISGRKVQNPLTATENMFLDLSNEKSGVYFIRAWQANDVATFKVIKK